MVDHPETQYVTDANLRARQRFWEHKARPFDLMGWVLDLVEIREGDWVLDVGCGNGSYLRALGDRGVAVTNGPEHLESIR